MNEEITQTSIMSKDLSQPLSSNRVSESKQTNKMASKTMSVYTKRASKNDSQANEIVALKASLRK